MTLRTVTNDRLVDGAKIDNLPANTNSSLAAKQDLLVSGSNIKTVNGESLLGSGDIPIAGGSGTVTNVSSANTDISVANPTTTPVLSLNSGTSANQIVKLDGSAKLPAVDGSQLTGLTKAQVGLGNVDNTADANKPISTATQTALNAKQDTLTLTTTGTSGAATLVGSTLNIPQYSSGGGATTFQQIYQNSATPQITTDSTNGPVDTKNGSGSDNNKTSRWLNNAGTEVASIDGQGLVKGLNHVGGLTTTATSAGTTTLTVASNYNQQFTGSTTQTVVLPVASTLSVGHSFLIMNRSTGIITVNSSGGNLVQTMAPSSQTIVTCVLASGTTAASWDSSYSVTNAGSGGGLTWGSSISSGTGTGITMTTSDLAGDKPFFTRAHTASGTLTANTTTQSSMTMSRTNTATTGTVTDNYVGQLFSRTNVQNGTGGTLLAQGSVVNITGTDTQTLGTLTPSYHLLKLDPSLRSTGSSIFVNVPNSVASAPTNGHIYGVISDTQTVSQTLLKLDVGNSSVGHVALKISASTPASTGQFGIVANFSETTNTTGIPAQPVTALIGRSSAGVGLLCSPGTSAENNPRIAARTGNNIVSIVGGNGIQSNANNWALLVLTDNQGATLNVPQGIEVDFSNRTGGSVGKLLQLLPGTALDTALQITIPNSTGAMTSGWVNYTLGNTQASASVIQKIDLGTSAQGHTGLLVNAYGASSTQTGILVDKSSTGTGNGIQVLSSLSSVGTQEDIIGIERTNAGAVGARPLAYFKNNSGQSKGKIINANIGYFFLENATANSGYIDIDNPRGLAAAGTGYLISGNKSNNATINGPLGAFYHNTAFVASESTSTQPLLYIQADTSTNNIPLVRGSVIDIVTSSATVTNPLVTDFSRITRQRTNTHTTGTLAENYALNYFKRTSIQNGAGGTFTAAGSVLKVENVATQTAGTLTDTVNPLLIVQSANSTGAAAYLSTAGTGKTAFKFDTGFTTSTAPTGASTYINIDIGGTSYKILAQAT